MKGTKAIKEIIILLSLDVHVGKIRICVRGISQMFTLHMSLIRIFMQHLSLSKVPNNCAINPAIIPKQAYILLGFQSTKCDALNPFSFLFRCYLTFLSEKYLSLEIHFYNIWPRPLQLEWTRGLLTLLINGYQEEKGVTILMNVAIEQSHMKL